MDLLTDKMKKRIQHKGRGAIFAAQDFLDLGSRAAVDQALSRLARRGVIRRIARGLYDYPSTNPRLNIEISPDPGKVARALARKAGGRLQVTGAQAANALGLSTQVPAQVVYHTDGMTKRVRIGRQTIELRRAAPRTMAQAGKKSGLVVQALRYLGKDHVDGATIAHLRGTLSEKDKTELRNGIIHTPAWMHPVIEKISNPEGD